MAKSVVIEDFRLPANVVAEMNAVAKLAGVSVNTVIKVILSLEVRKSVAREGQPA